MSPSCTLDVRVQPRANRVEVVRGASGRDKTLQIEGLDEVALRRALLAE